MLYIVSLCVLFFVLSTPFFVRAYLLAYKISHPKRCTVKKNNPAIQQAFSVLTKDKIWLNCVKYQGIGIVKGTIIVCHNLGGNKEHALSLYGFLLEEGYQLISFDFRNHGESQSSHSIKFKFIQDFEAFYSHIRPQIKKMPVGIIGLSIGCQVAIYGMSKNDEIQCMVLDSGPLIYSKDYFCYVLKIMNISNYIVKKMFVSLFQKFAGFSKLMSDTKVCLHKLQSKPIMMVVAEKDYIIPEINSIEVFKIIKSEKSIYWKVPSSHHLTNATIGGYEYKDRIRMFFKNTLSN